MGSIFQPCDCANTTVTGCTTGCASTLNAECVRYKGNRLSFESPSIKDNSSRTLSSILEAVSLSNSTDRPSKIVEGDYTFTANDTNKIIILKGFDDGAVGTTTYILTLPETLDFANKELIIKNITRPIDPSQTTILWHFNIPIQYVWNPAPFSSNDFDLLDSPTHKTLRLRFIQTSPTAYQWVVVD